MMDITDPEVLMALRELEIIDSVRDSRRKNRGIDYYIPNPMQFKAHLSKARTIIFSGGNRCLGRETKIYDPMLGVEREVGSIDSDFHVLAWDGTGLRITKALKPFRKNVDKLYKITLSNGGEFTASMSHVVLTPHGFRTISDVQVGSELFLPQTILEPFPSAHVGDDQSSYRKAEGSQSDYRALLRLCDELLLKEEDTSQVSFPSLYDAQEHTSSSASWNMGVLGSKSSDSQTYQQSFHLSNLDVQNQAEARYCGTLSGTSYTASIPVDSNTITLWQSAHGYNSQESTHESYQHPKYASYTYSPYEPSLVVITSIVYVRNDYKYDFTVPFWHNYFAGGCVHHNCGKSTLGATELTWHLTRKYPDWFPKERRFKRPIKAVVVCDANQKIEKVIEPKVNEYLPKSYIQKKRVVGGYLNRLECVDGSTVDFLSGEQDDMAFEGADWDFYWGDEPQKKRKFDAIMRGLIDRGGHTLLTFTPLVEPWMKEDLLDKADGSRIEAFIVDTYDNLFDINGNEILKKENIDEMVRLWDDDTKETRIHGKFFHLRGIVYSEFSEVHQIEFEYQYPDPVISVLDPHDRQPHHVIWAIVDRTGDLFVHSELSVACTVQELAKKVKAQEKYCGYRMKRRLIDPNFGRKPLITTGRNMIEELAKSGCPGWAEADDPKDEGHLKVKDYLHYDRTQEISHTNKPKLYFHKQRVPKTIHSIRNYQYEEWIGKIAGERDPKEKPKDKDTHGADCVRYLCMSNPRWSPVQEESYEMAQAPY